MLVGNHTFTGLILRPPATSVAGLAEDELRLKDLGDEMARETNYVSQYGYQLYDTTGSLDDYTYGGLGAYSYTPEIGKENFHPNYVNGFIPEYDGRPREDPDTGDADRPEAAAACGRRTCWRPRRRVGCGRHSVIRGTAPRGTDAAAHAHRDTNPSTAARRRRGQRSGRDDLRDAKPYAEVPASGEFEWHVPPSRQPGSTGPERKRLRGRSRVWRAAP